MHSLITFLTVLPFFIMALSLIMATIMVPIFLSATYDHAGFILLYIPMMYAMLKWAV